MAVMSNPNQTDLPLERVTLVVWEGHSSQVVAAEMDCLEIPCHRCEQCQTTFLIPQKKQLG